MKNTNSKKSYSRRTFLHASAIVGAGLSLFPFNSSITAGGSKLNAREKLSDNMNGKRVGIIGLDTSHSEVFTRAINTGEGIEGYKVVAAYPHGSRNIPSALKMKPDIIAKVKAMGVEIVDSIDTLLKNVDVVLLETNDGRPHYEQALPVLKAGKRMFIDKPIAADFAGAKKIFSASEKYNTPIFSSSALRFDTNVQKVVNGSIGKVLGADVYTPAEIELSHIDLAWYGIHGVEMLFTVMGPGCKQVSRVYEKNTDLVTGVWEDGRVGTVRGIRKGATNIAGTAFGEKGIAPLGPFSSYGPLVREIISFFETGKPPVEEVETLEIFAFMQAADESKRKKGATIRI